MKPKSGIQVRLRVRRLADLMELAGIGTNAALAQRMGNVSESTVSRFRNTGDVSVEAIAGLLKAFAPMPFEDLFEMSDGDDEQADAA